SRSAAQSHRDHGAGGGVSRGIGGRLLEGPETDRGAVAGGSPLHARDEAGAAPAARGRVAQGARAGQRMGGSMEVVIKRDYDQMSKAAAQLVVDVLNTKPNAVLGMATGSTPLGLYQELCACNQAWRVDCFCCPRF